MSFAADTLLTPRLVLRRPRAGDLPAYEAYCASDRSRFVGGPFSVLQAFDKLAAMIGHWALRGMGRYVLERNGDPIGHAGPLQPFADKSAELTWTLWHKAHEGQGYATEAASAIARHLLSDCGLPGLDIYVLPANSASLRVADRLGARRVERPGPDWAPDALTFRLESAA